MPIYLEKVDRPLCDPAAGGASDESWHPGNSASHRLFRCVECLRDLNDLCAEAGAHRNPVKRRRKLKHMFVPMLSLAESLVDLIHILQSDPDALGRMQPTDPKLLTQVKNRYLEFVPLGSKDLLRRVRNKVAAHIDERFSPADARSLLDQVNPADFGSWWHTSLTVLSDLLKLNVYSWYAATEDPQFYRLMYTEPLLSTFRIEDGRMVELVGMNLVSRSPRALVFDLIREAVTVSDWMFGPDDARIRGFSEDAKGTSWARSLQTLAALKPQPGA